MNSIKILILGLILFSCNQYEKKDKFKMFNFLSKKKTTLIISCIKCNCIIEELNNIFKTGVDTTTLQIYGDSTCLSSLNSKIRFTQLNQQIIDSLSTDFYNVLIITKTPVNRTYNVISTNESSKLKSYIE